MTDTEIEEWISGEFYSDSIDKKLIKRVMSFAPDDELINRSIRSNYDGPTGKPYKKDRPSDDRPAGLSVSDLGYQFFYYFGVKQDRSIFSRVFGSELSVKGQIDEEKIKNWVSDAQDKDLNTLQASSVNFLKSNPEDIEWHQPSFLIFFFDSNYWNFFDRQDGTKVRNYSIHFATERGHNRNGTFYEAKTFDVSGIGKMVVVENHHLKAGTKDKRVSGDTSIDPYKFDLYYQIPFDDGSGLNLIMIIDPGGRNTGPPSGGGGGG